MGMLLLCQCKRGCASLLSISDVQRAFHQYKRVNHTKRISWIKEHIHERNGKRIFTANGVKVMGYIFLHVFILFYVYFADYHTNSLFFCFTLILMHDQIYLPQQLRCVFLECCGECYVQCIFFFIF
jgi:hypothetical protein